MHPRPTSPHLSIYSWLMTNTLSILHRITGFALSIGSVLFVAWLVSAAYFPDFFHALHILLSSVVGQILLFGWTAAFYYHLCNGIRHLTWDAGRGLEIHAAYKSGVTVLVATVAMTLLTWACIMFKTSGAM